MINAELVAIDRMNENAGGIYVLPNGTQLLVSEAGEKLLLLNARKDMNFNDMNDDEVSAWIVKNTK